MPKTKISEFSTTPANNTDIDGINIAEGCAPSGINDAIRELMSQLKDWQAGLSGDVTVVAAGGTGVGTLTGIVKGNGTSAMTAVTAPSGAIVGDTDTQTLTNKTLTSPTINTGVLSNPTVTNYVETPFTANSSTAITLALTNGTVQIITLTGNATITMPTATSGKSFIMLLKQDATGSRTVTWSTVKWAGGTAPTITSTASRQDILSFFADGTNWYGVVVAQNYTP
jgi:FtsP/CotA-like multicopper oxidase with cupredoxin domain